MVGWVCGRCIRCGEGKEGRGEEEIWVWPFKLGRGRRLIWRDAPLQQIRAQNLQVPQRLHSIQEPCPKYVALGPYLAGTLPIPPGRHSDLADETCGPDRHSCDPAAEPRCCTPQKLWQVAPIFLFPAVVAAYSVEGICGRLHGVLPPVEGTRRVPSDLGRTGKNQSSPAPSRRKVRPQSPACT